MTTATTAMTGSKTLTVARQWALNLLEGAEPSAKRSRTTVEQPRIDSLTALGERLALDDLARRLVLFAWAAARSSDVGAALRERGGLTVELLRLLFGGGVDGALRGDRPLRRYALLDGSAASYPSPGDVVALGPAVAERLAGESGTAESLVAGARIVGPVVDQTFWVASHPPSPRGSEVVKEIADRDAQVVSLDACPAREAIGLAVGLARRLGRAVLLVDGAQVAAQPRPATTAAALRREAELERAVLVVYQASALGAAWRATAVASSAGAAPLVVLADAERAPELLLVEPLTALALTMYAAAPSGPVANASATPAAASPPAQEKKEDGYEQIRAQATRDAERAMGIIRPQLPRAAPPPPPVQVVAPVEKPVESTPIVATAPPLVEKSPEAPKKKRSRKAMEHFGPDLDDDPTAAPSAAPLAPPATAPPAPTVERALTPTAVAAVADGSLPEGPAMAMAADASPDEMARVAIHSPNASQRIELIRRMVGMKHTAVVASLRHNAQSAHPGVRTAAEAVMATMFGDNWNKARPIPKPVQPPRSEDKGGGW